MAEVDPAARRGRLRVSADDAAFDEAVAQIQQRILDEAATWEVQFDAGPGEVVSVSDAAHVAARWFLASG